MKKILQITLGNGCFRETNGVNVIEFKPRTVKANGWECYVEKSGRIFCHVIEGNKELRYCIFKSGYSRMTCKRGNGCIKTIKEGYVIGKNESIKNGVIFLTDGDIKNRYTFFRSEGLQKFHEDYGIYRMYKQEPNTVYSVKNAHCNHLEASGEVIPDIGTWCEIITDGTKKNIGEVWGNKEKPSDKFPNCSAFELEEMIEVKNATWVIKHIKTWRGSKVREYRFLYSLKDYSELQIPEQYCIQN